MNTRTKTILVGVLIGAGTGLVAAMMWNRRAANEGTTDITAGDGLKLGVMIIGLLRAIASLGEEEDKKKRRK